MEPARAPLDFERIPDAEVVLIIKGSPVVVPLWHLAGELFAERLGFNVFIPLLKDGFTDSDYIRWEHFPDPSVNIRCNFLGRMVCQS